MFWFSVVQTVCCFILSANMGSNVVTKKFNFALVRSQHFLEIVIIMLQIGFSRIQSGFNVSFLEHRSVSRGDGFSNVAGEVPN